MLGLLLVDAPDGGVPDALFTPGNLLTIASFIVIVTVYVVNARNAAKILGTRLSSIDTMLSSVQDEIKTLQRVVTEQAVQSVRMQGMEDRITQMSKRHDDVVILQGQRLDDLTRRVNDFMDTRKYRPATA